METIRQYGYRVDTGATAFAARYPIAAQLAKELGLSIVDTAPYLGVYRNGRVRPLRLDRLIRSGLTTDVLTMSAKPGSAWRGGSAKGRFAAATYNKCIGTDYIRQLLGK